MEVEWLLKGAPKKKKDIFVCEQVKVTVEAMQQYTVLFYFLFFCFAVSLAALFSLP